MIKKVQVLDNETLLPLWLGSDIMDVQVQETSTVTKYAVEDGTNRNDHIVHNPTEITMRFTLAGEVSQFFSAIKQTYTNRDLITVQTRTDVYADMIVTDIPQEQSGAAMDAVTLDIRLSEWREVVPEYGELTQAKVAKPEQSTQAKVAKPEQSSTVKRGSQATTEAPPAKKQSVLRSIF